MRTQNPELTIYGHPQQVRTEEPNTAAAVSDEFASISHKKVATTENPITHEFHDYLVPKNASASPTPIANTPDRCKNSEASPTIAVSISEPTNGPPLIAAS